MQIILQGTEEEIRRWIRQQMRMTGKKMLSYVGLSGEDGTGTYIVQEGTKEDFPRQRIVRNYRKISRQKGA